MRPFFVRRVLYPLMETLERRNFRKLLEDYTRLQFCSGPELKARQEEKLRRLVQQAYAHVPFYRERFQALGLRPEDIQSLEDLAKFPVVGKEDIRKNFPGRMVADNIPPSRRLLDRTSGSTGVPLVFYRDKAARDQARASFLLFSGWAGLRPGERTVHIGAPQPFSLRSRLSSLLRGHRDISVFNMDARNTGKILASLSRIRPVLIEGYASAIFQIAQTALRLNIRLSPRAVVTTSDTLPSPEPIRSAFGCPVFNRYGNREICGALAQNCPEGRNLHVNTELCILEIVDEQGRPVPAGRSGRLVLTDLANWVMPLIRLDSGDMATAGGECSCGRGFPLVSRIEGRSSNYLTSPQGLRISPVALSHFLFVTRPYIRHFLKFQAEQHEPDRVTFRFVPLGSLPEDLKRALLLDLREFLGRGVDVRLEFVEDIPAEAGGKQAVIKSSLPRPVS
jgi:phenylacetate-CoA ligase